MRVELRLFAFPHPLQNRRESGFVNGGAHSVPALWYNHGYTPERLADWWDVKTYATDDRGNCRGSYNPTINYRTRLLDFRWILPATDDNAAALLAEIARRAGIKD